MRKLFYLLLLGGLAVLPLDIFGQLSLSTTNAAGNGSGGVTFEVTATRNVRLHRVWIQHNSGSGTTTAEIWGRPGGMNNNITISNGWTQLASNVSIPVSVGNPVQIPVDLNIILPAGQTYGFYVGSSTTVAYSNTGTLPLVYSDGNISINCNGWGGSVPSPVNFPRIYNGRVDYFVQSGGNDAGVVSIDSVSAACPGNQNIWATIGNYGANQIDSVTVNWSWNGTLQTPIQLITLLDTFGGMGSTTAPVFLATQNLAAGQIYNLSVWTSNPNGVADTSNYNDTIHTQLAASLQGLYTINSGAATSGSNFSSFTEAVDALNTYGVCGPTTFAVVANSGPYHEQITIGEIAGASSVNTITFEGGLTKEEIWVDGSMTSSNDRHVIKLNGADYVRLQNLTVTNKAASGSGTQYGFGIHLTNDADYNIVDGCLVEVDSAGVQTSSNFAGITISGLAATSAGSNGNHNIIRNNKVHGGYYGITAMGVNTSSYGENNRIENNEVTGTWYYNMYCYYQTGLQVIGNYVEHRKPSNTAGYGILIGYNDTVRVEKNTVIDPLTYGIYLTSGNRAPGSTTPSGTAHIINNSVSGDYTAATTRGMYFASYVQNVKVYHNSVSVTSGTSTSCAALYIGTSTTNNNLDIRNNSFAVFNTNSGYAYYSGSSNPSQLNYNNYYNDGDTTRVIYLSGVVSLSALNGAGGFNQASYHGDPQYLNNYTDLHSKGTQLWNRGGLGLGVVEDIDGDVRPGMGSLLSDIGSDEYQVPQLDIAPTALVSPTLPICPGTFNIVLDVTNYGQMTIDTLTVNWWVNGVAQAPFVATSANIATSASGAISVGTLNITGGQPYDIVFVTSMPNNGIDEDAANDTLGFYGLRTGLPAGNYTINKNMATAGSNYNSFQDAINDINANGICGSVVFNVAPGSGPYKEQISLEEVVGVSPTSTITFDGGLTKEEIWVDAGMTNTSNRHVIKLDGADFIRIQNLTISNHAASGSGTQYGFGVHLTNGANHNIVDGCIVEVDSAEQQTGGNFAGITISGLAATSSGTNGSNNIIRNNKIHGGYYGVTVMGTNSSTFEVNNRVENNEITGQRYYNMYCYYQSGLHIEGNHLQHRSPFNTAGYGMYLLYQDSMKIIGNTIIDPIAYGIYTSVGNKAPGNTSPPSGPAYIVNNCISGYYNTTAYGIYVAGNTENARFYHNSVSLTAGTGTNNSGMYVSTTTTNNGLDVQNNSFAVFNTSVGYALYGGNNNFFALDNNNFFHPDTTRVLYMSGAQSVGSFQGAGGYNTNSYFGDPQYLDIYTDLHSKGTQLWDRGNDTLGISEDIDGDLRPGFGGTIPDIGCDEFQPPQLDISPSAMLNPTLPICPGSFNVIIDVQNLGQATIDTFTVNWFVNGTAQTPFTVTSANMATNTGTTVSLGNLTIVGNQPYDIVFVTSGPNNGVDEDPRNDTLGLYGLRTGLPAGNYTINKNLPTAGINYNSFQDAIDDLNNFGICGSVVFAVAPGTGPYEEQIILGEVVGTSSTSTITFDGGATKEEIFADSVNTSNQRAVIIIDGGDWIVFKNLTINNHAPATGTWYSYGVQLINNADHNTIDGCVVDVDSAEVSSSSFRAGIVLTGSFTSPTSTGQTGEHNTFSNNQVHGGYYGITQMGVSSVDHKVNNRILNNDVRGQYYMGIYSYGQDGSEIEGNRVELRRAGTTSGYGIYNYYCDSFTVAKNTIIGPKLYGIYFYAANRYNTGSTFGKVENNMISGYYSSTTRYGIAMSSYCRKVNVYHNSVSIPYSNAYAFRLLSSTQVDSISLVNNSFAVFDNGSYPVYLIDSMQVSEMNYNNFYSPDGSAVYMNNTLFDNTNYRGAGTWNIASRFGDPGYIDNDENLHVLSAQLWNAGNNQVGVIDDIDGDVRPDSFIVDIGADEFRPPAHEAGFNAFIEPVSACGYSAASSVTVEFQNAGLEPIDTIELSYRVNGGTIVTETATFNPGILSGATGIYTFTTTANLLTPGLYTLDGWVNLMGDNLSLNDSLTGFEVWHDLNVNTFPYFEDFEAGPGGWRAGGISGQGEWQWGLPRGTDIDTAASGVKAWMTDTTADYQNGQCSWLLSPCYDFTNLNLPFIKMYINYDSENSWDGVQLQASTDSGATWTQVGAFNSTVGNPINWYNDNTISGLGTCLNLQEGWTNNSGGWIQAEISLQPFANQPDIRFRFFFGSDGSVNTGYDGFAVDDIEIADVPPNDLSVIQILEPNSGACGDSSMAVSVVVKNNGSLEKYNYPISVGITDTPAVSIGTLTVVSPDTIYPGQTDTVFIGTFNSSAGGSFTFVGYTNLTGDFDRSNDTTIAGPIDINPIPAPPVVNDLIFCEADSGILQIVNPDTNFTYNWYATDTSSVAIAEDTFQYQTPFLTQSTTYWVQKVGSDGGNPILFTEWNLGGTDMIEIANLSGRTVDATGWVVATSSSYSDINLVNTILWQLGSMSAGQVDYKTDNTSNNYWGNNLFWNEGTGQSWVLIIDNNGVVVDAVFYNWSASDIANFNTTINGFTITAADIPWTGNGLAQAPSVTNSFDRIGSSDNDDITDWTDQISANEGILNSQISPTFSGGQGCSSARVPVQVIISPIASPNLGPDNVVCGGVLLDAGPGYAKYQWSTSDSTQSAFVDLSGTYNVLVSDINGCTGSDTINLIINPNPVVDLGPDTTVCGSILLDADNPGATWTWHDATVSQTYLAATTRDYFVNVVDQNGCETRDTINVTINALPPVDLGVDRVECDSVLLDAMNVGLPTLWSTGSTSQTLSVTASGSYWVSVTDPTTTCEAIDTVNLTINTSPVVDLGPDGDYCDILVLDAGNPGSLFNWSTGDLSQTVIITSTTEGTISTIVTDLNGCQGKDTITVNIVDQPVIGFTETRDPVNLSDYTFTNSSSGENITYSWDFGDGSATVNTRDAMHTYATPGIYQACLTISNACDTITDCVEVQTHGVGIEDELLANSISLYPNPTTDKINIDFTGLNEDVEVMVSDVTGRILYKDVITRFEQARTTTFDLSDEAEGVYTLIFKMGEHRLARRVVRK